MPEFNKSKTTLLGSGLVGIERLGPWHAHVGEEKGMDDSSVAGDERGEIWRPVG